MAKKRNSYKKDSVVQTAMPEENPAPLGRTNSLLALLARSSPSRIILLLSLASCLAYANSLGGDFLFDDAEQIVENQSIRSWDNLGRAFSTHVWAFRERPEALYLPVPPPYYRPVFTILLTVGYQLFGLWPQGWHLLSLLLHILCSIGVYYVLRELSRQASVAVVAALLFAVYPIHVESVSWISGVTDPLFGVFYLASFYAYLRYRAQPQRRALLVYSLLCFALAAYSKETALSLVGLVFVREWVEAGDGPESADGNLPAKLFSRFIPPLKAALPYLAVAGLYLVPRFLVLGSMGWDNPHTYKGPVIHTLFTLPWVLGTYVLHLLWPIDLSIAYNTSFVSSLADVRFLVPTAALVLVVGGLILYRKKVSKEVWYAIALFLLPMLPVLDIRKFITDFLVSDRYLYLPVAGCTFLLALGLAKLAEAEERRAARQAVPVSAWQKLGFSSLLMVALVGGLTVGTLRESRSWANEIALWTNAARVRPEYLGAHYKLGLALYEAKRYPESLAAFVHTFENSDRKSTAIYNAMGRSQAAMGEYARAIENFKLCLEIDPNSFDGLNNLGTVYFNSGDYKSAERYFKSALALRPQAIEFNYNLGLCYSRQGRYAEAVPELEQALLYAPNDVEIIYELGIVYEKVNRREDAMRLLQRGISLSKSQTLTEKLTDNLNRLAKN